MPEDEDEMNQLPDGATLVPVRRRPDMVHFLVTGAVVGAVLGGILGYFGPDAPDASTTQEVILLAGTGAIFVTLIAAILYLVADRATRRG